jgi:hypothetical protein
VTNDPHVKFADFDRRGYGVVTITKTQLGYEVFANVPSGTRTLET